MKVQIIRVSALGIVLILGVVAIIQVQHATRRSATASEPSSVAALVGSKGKETGPNPLRKTVSAASADPFLQRTSGETLDQPPARLPLEPAGLSNRSANEIPDAAPFGNPNPRATARVDEPKPMPVPPGSAAARSVPAAPFAAPAPSARTVSDRYRDDRYNTARNTSAVEDPYGDAGAPANLPSDAVTDGAELAPLRTNALAAPARVSRDVAPATSGAWPPGDAAADPFPAAPARDPLRPTQLPSPRAALESTDAMQSLEGTGRPGGKQLEGPQSPQLTILKTAPAEIQVGKPALFKIAVRNTGAAPASGVEIHDQVPKGTKFLNSTPRAQRGPKGDLLWTLGTIKPGDESVVEVQLMPQTEGEIGSVATVLFTADASARCVATRPQLVVESQMPDRVKVGEEVPLKITVTNPGTGIATGVVINERSPAGIQHPSGPELEYAVGDLKPGESRKLDLVMVATKPGLMTNLLTARGEGNLFVEDRKEIEVTAPALEIALEGPKKRYLEREAVYQISIANPGTAAAEQIDLVAWLPPGLKFVSTNNAGVYDEVKRAVRWRLEELPVNQRGGVELVTIPTDAGNQSLKLQASAQRGATAEKEHPVVIEGIAAILFQVADTADPIAVGGETTYEVKVTNQGSKAASNICLSILLPPELKPLAADGPTRNQVSGNRVVFDGLASLAPKADTSYRVRVQGLSAGDLRTRIQLVTDEMQSPVTKEESTRVYADE